jgi:hypothetical protein
MRIKVVQTPPLSDVDGIRLDVFRPGVQYEMGTNLGALFLAEGWGEPAPSDEPAMVVPISGLTADGAQNLIRDTYPPGDDGPLALAADGRRRRRTSSSD